MVVLLLVTGAYCTASQAADSIVGSWRLVSWVEVETESKSVHSVFGDNPTEMITYTGDGRIWTGYLRLSLVSRRIAL